MTTSISDASGGRAPSTDIRVDIRSRAAALGFEACGFASAAESWDAGDRLDAFLAAGRHGTMAWMEWTAARRRHPSGMWPEARTAIIVGMNYGPDRDPRESLDGRANGTISVYAKGRDYHQLIKGRLKHLAGFVARATDAQVKVFVDTAPLMEKPLAQRAGLGWQGKHTNLVSREHGSWLFLGAILTTADLLADAPSEDYCGACRACIEICPTGAIVAPYQLDARACISYLTIEHAGPVDERYRAALGNRIYGCDDCLAACPWNKFAHSAAETRLHETAATRDPGLTELAELDDAAFRARFSASPIKRIGRDRFVRNVLYAVGNSAELALAPAAAARLEDTDETVRDAARWALAKLNAADKNLIRS